MKKRIYRICALFLAGTLSMTIFTGCSKEQTKETVKETAKETTAAPENSTEAAEEMELSDEELTDEVKQITTELTEPAPFDQNSAFSESIIDPGVDPTPVKNLGSFKIRDIHETEYTEEMFKDYDLTMINLFTTWCTPCVGEIPELQKLKDEMAEKGVNVIGVVLDADDGTGNINEEAVEKAKLIAEKTGASYPFLLPDETKMNGRLNNIDSVPETFFVDKDGNIVGETYVGSRSFEDWKSVVEKELSNLKGAN